MEKRIEHWESFFRKYEARGKLNTADCAFFEVHYKHFIKPRIKRFTRRKRNRNINRNFSDNNILRNNFKNARENLETIDLIEKTDNEVTDISLLKSTKRPTIIENNMEKYNTYNVFDKYAKESTPLLKNKEIDDYETHSINNFNEVIENLESNDIVEKIDGASLIISAKEPTIIVNNNFENRNMDDVFDKYDKESTPLVKNREFENCEADRYDDRFGKNSVEDLKHFIEVNLNSNLKEVLNSRSESKILETDDYSYWHKRTKQEMSRLQKHVTKTELKKYVRYYNNKAERELDSLHDIIVNQLKSKIKELLIKRELVRNNKDKYLKYRQKICDEWQKLLKDLNIEWIISYASGVIKTFKLNSLDYEEPINWSSDEILNDSPDSGCNLSYHTFDSDQHIH